MEFRKMVTITLYTRQQKRHWCIEQSFGLCGRGWDDLGECHWNMYNIIYETSLQSRFDAWYWMLGAGALGRPRGMVQGGRREKDSGWGTRVYLWRTHVDIWQNQYNIVKLKKKISLSPGGWLRLAHGHLHSHFPKSPAFAHKHPPLKVSLLPNCAFYISISYFPLKTWMKSFGVFDGVSFSEIF